MKLTGLILLMAAAVAVYWGIAPAGGNWLSVRKPIHEVGWGVSSVDDSTLITERHFSNGDTIRVMYRFAPEDYHCAWSAAQLSLMPFDGLNVMAQKEYLEKLKCLKEIVQPGEDHSKASGYSMWSRTRLGVLHHHRHPRRPPSRRLRFLPGMLPGPHGPEGADDCCTPSNHQTIKVTSYASAA